MVSRIGTVFRTRAISARRTADRVRPDPGYEPDKIIWSLNDGSASCDITESRNFSMPAMDAVVYVTFRPIG